MSAVDESVTHEHSSLTKHVSLTLMSLLCCRNFDSLKKENVYENNKLVRLQSQVKQMCRPNITNFVHHNIHAQSPK